LIIRDALQHLDAPPKNKAEHGHTVITTRKRTGGKGKKKGRMEKKKKKKRLDNLRES